MTRLPDPALPWPIPMPAVDLVAEAEGCRLQAYRCPAGVWTIGWGETAADKAVPGATCTQAQADEWLCDSLGAFAVRVRAVLTEYATPEQLGAMVSLAYNVGVGGFSKSSVLAAHNRGDTVAAAEAFGLWNKARVGGALTVLPGLVRRRKQEAALYLTPDIEAPGRMPQAVAEPQALPASTRVQTGAVLTLTGAAGAIQASGADVGVVGTAIETAKSFSTDTLGVPAEWFLPALLLGAGAFLVHHWLTDRKRGAI